MRSLRPTTLLRRGFSDSRFGDASLPFYKLVEVISKAKIPENYQRDVFSKLIQDTATVRKDSDTAHKTLALSPKLAGLAVRKPDYALSAGEYAALVKEEPFGSLETFKFRGTEVCVLGACLTHIPPQNIWKLLELFQPDLVMVQAFPDDFLGGFKLNHTNPKTGRFNEAGYLRGLYASAPLLFTDKLYDKVFEALETHAKATFAEDFTTRFRGTLKEGLCAREGLPPLKSYDKVTDEALATASIFTQQRDLPLVFSDIPDLILRNKLCVELGLSELKKMLETTTENIAKNPDFTPDSPMNLGHLSYPQALTQPSDTYTATLLNAIVVKHNPSRVFVLGGNFQGKTLRSYLAHRRLGAIHDELSVENFKKNLFEAHSMEILAEKLGVLDVLKHGRDILTRKITSFPQSIALLQKYSGFSADNPKLRYHHYLHQQMVRKYLERHLEIHQKGVRELHARMYEKLAALQKEARVECLKQE